MRRWIGLLATVVTWTLSPVGDGAELTGAVDPASLPGIVVDDKAAQVTGQWAASTHSKPYVGEGYLHDETKDKGKKSVRFVPDLPAAGEYQVLFAYSAGGSRSTNTPVTIYSTDGETTVAVNQRTYPADMKPFVSLGTFKFEKGTKGAVVVSNAGTEGHVTVDAVQFIPVDDKVPAASVVQKVDAPEKKAQPQLIAKPTPPARPQREYKPLTTASLDELLRKHLAGTQVAGPISDERFLRRVMLDLVGRQPTPEEAAAFLQDQDAAKRSKLIDALLASDEFGKNWANYWSDTFSFRTPPPELSYLDFQPFKDWLAQRLNSNAPWDEITREILSASGKVKDNPAATFIGFHEGSQTRLASETARVFMGVQIQCAECHDHPFDDWKREQFHELAAFFVRVQAKAAHRDSTATEVKSSDKGEYQMPDMADPRKKGPPMQPVMFTYGQSLELGAADTDRRTALASWVTERDNSWFAQAYTNRIWARLMGRGFYEPVDSIGGLNFGEATDIHQALSDHFVAGGYDVKELFRLVMNTEAYQRGQLESTNPEETKPFAVAEVVRLRGDQVFDALVTSIGLENVTPPPDKPTAENRFPPPPKSTRDLVNETFGFDPSLPNEEIVRTLSQSMLLMNNEQVQARVSADPESGTLLATLLAETADDRVVIEKLYLQVLARAPQESEVAIGLDHLAKLSDRRAAYEDILWGLINSAEFTTRR